MSADEIPPGVDIPPEFDFKLYRYTPTLAGAIVALVVFAVLTAVHFWRLIRARSFYFVPFLVGGICAYRVPMCRVSVLAETILTGCFCSSNYRLLRTHLVPL